MATTCRRRFRAGPAAAFAALLWAAAACEPLPESGIGGTPGGGTGPVAAMDPATLDGLDAGRLTGLLGEPELRRQEPPAEVWQYRTDSCVLDVFLYTEGGRLHVVHSEARPRTATGSVDAGRCLGALARGRTVPHAPAHRPG